MKKSILILIAVLILVIFQTSFLAPWFSGYFSPDLLLASLMAATVIFGFNQVWSTVIAAGMIMDLFSYSRLGSHVVIFILAAYLISFVSRRFSVSDKGLGIAVAFFWITLATWLENWGMLFLENWGNQKIFFSLSLAESFGLSALANIALFFATHSLLKKIKKYYYPAKFKFGK